MSGVLAGLAILRLPLPATGLIPTTKLWLLAIGSVVIELVTLFRAFIGDRLAWAALGVFCVLLGGILLFKPVFAGLHRSHLGNRRGSFVIVGRFTLRRRERSGRVCDEAGIKAPPEPIAAGLRRP